jgi:hypothetical protein
VLPPDDQVPTLAELQRGMPWCSLHCAGHGCSHSKPVAIAPFVIRWGAEASSNILRRSARCTVCGHLGAATYHPGVTGMLLNPYPVDHGNPL